MNSFLWNRRTLVNRIEEMLIFDAGCVIRSFYIVIVNVWQLFNFLQSDILLDSNQTSYLFHGINSSHCKYANLATQKTYFSLILEFVIRKSISCNWSFITEFWMFLQNFFSSTPRILNKIFQLWIFITAF